MTKNHWIHLANTFLHEGLDESIEREYDQRILSPQSSPCSISPTTLRKWTGEGAAVLNVGRSGCGKSLISSEVWLRAATETSLVTPHEVLLEHVEDLERWIRDPRGDFAHSARDVCDEVADEKLKGYTYMIESETDSAYEVRRRLERISEMIEKTRRSREYEHEEKRRGRHRRGTIRRVWRLEV